jgi:hypothetical protein
MIAGTRTLRASTLTAPARALVALAPLMLSGCVMFQQPQGISVSSDPPGASVLIDEKDSGFVTPCVLAIDPDEHSRVDLVLTGYRRETRFITPDREVYSILWREMSVGTRAWDFPLFLNLRDFFVPVKVSETSSPGRIFVHLDRAADAATAVVQ